MSGSQPPPPAGFPPVNPRVAQYLQTSGRMDTPLSRPGNPTVPVATGRPSPIVNLAPVLGKTPYSDAKDKNPKPDEYIRLQRNILQWLDTHATDQLSSRQAHRWTEQIDPDSGVPCPKLALSLCYYMREIGFSTYCRMVPEKNSFVLYVANPNTDARGTLHDDCYWEQNFKTGEVPPLSNFGFAMELSTMGVADAIEEIGGGIARLTTRLGFDSGMQRVIQHISGLRAPTSGPSSGPAGHGNTGQSPLVPPAGFAGPAASTSAFASAFASASASATASTSAGAGAGAGVGASTSNNDNDIEMAASGFNNDSDNEMAASGFNNDNDIEMAASGFNNDNDNEMAASASMSAAEAASAFNDNNEMAASASTSAAEAASAFNDNNYEMAASASTSAAEAASAFNDNNKMAASASTSTAEAASAFNDNNEMAASASTSAAEAASAFNDNNNEAASALNDNNETAPALNDNNNEAASALNDNNNETASAFNDNDNETSTSGSSSSSASVAASTSNNDNDSETPAQTRAQLQSEIMGIMDRLDNLLSLPDIGEDRDEIRLLLDRIGRLETDLM